MGYSRSSVALMLKYSVYYERFAKKSSLKINCNIRVAFEGFSMKLNIKKK